MRSFFQSATGVAGTRTEKENRIMNYKEFTLEVGGRKVTIETGKYAEQTNG